MEEAVFKGRVPVIFGGRHTRFGDLMIEPRVFRVTYDEDRDVTKVERVALESLTEVERIQAVALLSAGVDDLIREDGQP